MNAAANSPGAIILAGGFGTRVSHLLGDVPKPMAPAEGRPFLEWVVRYLASHGITEIAISTGFRAEAINRHFIRNPFGNANVHCVTETRPLGTGGAVLNALKAFPAIPDTVLIVNGDSLFLLSPQDLLDRMKATAADTVIAAREVEDTQRYGSLQTSAGGRIMAFREKVTGAGLINAGMYLLSQRALLALPLQAPMSLERDGIPALLQHDLHVVACPCDAPFLDIGTPETLPQAGKFISAHAAAFRCAA